MLIIKIEKIQLKRYKQQYRKLRVEFQYVIILEFQKCPPKVDTIL
jgi:hypothetical protein